MSTERIAQAALELTTDNSKYDAGLADAEKRLDRTRSQFKGAGADLASFGKGATAAGGVLSAGLTLPIIAGGAAVWKFGTDINEAMANVASLIPGNTARVRELKTAVQDMSITTGKSTKDLADGLYQVVSAFGDTSDSAKVLEINAKAATAGVATTTDAINLTSAVTKGYGDTSAKAVGDVSDLAFQAVKLGQTTFPELAASIGRVVPLSAELKVSQQELFGVMATATGVTGGASEVGTQLRGVLQSLMAPTEDMTALLESLGVKTGGALIEQRGLQGAIEAIVSASKSSGVPLGKFIGSIEGQTIALALAGPQQQAFTEKLAAMGQASGATEEAFKEQTTGINSAGFAWKQFKAEATVAIERLSDTVIPIVMRGAAQLRPLGDVVKMVIAEFVRMPQPVQTAGVVLMGLLAAAGPVLLIVGKLAGAIAAIIPWFAAGSAGAAAVGTALTVLTGPVGWAIAALVALAGASKASTGSWFAFLEPLKPILDLLLAVARLGLALVIGALQTLFGWLKPIASFIGNVLLKVFEGWMHILRGVGGVLGWLADKIDSLTSWIVGEKEAVEQSVAAHAQQQAAQQKTAEGADVLAAAIAGTTGAQQQQAIATDGVTAALGREAAAHATTNFLTSEARKRKEELAKAATEAAAKVRELAESLGGKDSIAKATEYLRALEQSVQLNQMSKAKQEEVLAVMAAALESYKALGTQAPAEVRKVHDELVRLVVLPKLIADANAEAATIVAAIREKERASAAAAFQETLDRHFEALKAARDFADKGYLASLTETERAVELAVRQRDESIRAIEPIKVAYPEIYREALGQIEREFNASLGRQGQIIGLSLSDFKKQFNDTFLGGNGWKGALEAVGGAAFPKATSAVKFGMQAWGAAARAFAGDWSGVMALAQQHMGKLIEFIGKGAKKIGAWLKGIFGGPNAQEIAGREVAAEFRNNLAGMMNDRQAAEAGNEEWAKSVIVVRDAYLAMGKTEAEALAAMDALWRAEKEGAGAVEEAIKPIQTALDWVAQQSEETGLSIDELRAQGVAAGTEITQSIRGAGDELEILGPQGERLANSLKDSLGRLKFNIPIDFRTAGMPDMPMRAMAEGGIGRVTRPTLFLAGEAGAEDFAFSGGGRRFGAGAVADGRPLQIDVNIDGRRAARALVPHIPGAVGALV